VAGAATSAQIAAINHKNTGDRSRERNINGIGGAKEVRS